MCASLPKCASKIILWAWEMAHGLKRSWPRLTPALHVLRTMPGATPKTKLYEAPEQCLLCSSISYPPKKFLVFQVKSFIRWEEIEEDSKGVGDEGEVVIKGEPLKHKPYVQNWTGKKKNPKLDSLKAQHCKLLVGRKLSNRQDSGGRSGLLQSWDIAGS